MNEYPEAGSARPMSHNVTRLKELLFDGEARALADLSRRIELIASSGEQQRRELAAALGRQMEQHARALADEATARSADVHRLEAMARALNESAAGSSLAHRDLAQKLDAVIERAGSDQRLEVAVARVVDSVLRRVEVEKHSAVADAMAPLVVRTIKTEIRNSQDELVEALYPMTGRMVKAYIASAMADLMEDINRKLKTNPLMLRLKSLTTGRSVAELALLETRRLTIEEVYLIRRGTGELIGRWPEARAQSNRDQVMSGVLTAINDFSAEAFKEDGSALRHIDLESSQVYLRASPTTLLAVRCSGLAHAAVERVIDDEFLDALQRHREALAAATPTATGQASDDGCSGCLGELASRLSTRVSATQEEMARPPLGLTPLRLAVLFIGMPLAAWGAWTAAETFKTSHVRSVAQRVIETSSEVKGYPISIAVTPWGRRLTISGLTPSTTAREDVVKRLTELLPGTELDDDQLTVVPTGGFDTRPQIADVRNELSRLQMESERSLLSRSIERSRSKLEQTANDLAALRDEAPSSDRKAEVARAAATVGDVVAALGASRKQLAEPGLLTAKLSVLKGQIEQASSRLAATQADIMAVLGGGGQASSPPAPRASTIEAAEELATQAERLAATTIAVRQANVIARRPPPERVVVERTAPPPQMPEPTAAQRLADLLRGNVVWFTNQTDFRDEARTKELLDRVAQLDKESGALLRIVGYTDEQGSAALNTQLAQARARRVADELLARGVARDRLVVVGRPGPGFDISPTRGPGSANRRVEMQIGFEGEEAAQ